MLSRASVPGHSFSWINSDFRSAYNLRSRRTMNSLIAFALLLTVAAAGVVNDGHNRNHNNHNNHNNNGNYDYNNHKDNFKGNNDLNIDIRDGNHQKFILELVRHLQQDVQQDEFIQFTTTIRLDNKGDYKVRQIILKTILNPQFQSIFRI